MNVTLPDSLHEFIKTQVDSGRFSSADAFVEELVRTEAQILKRIGSGEPLPVDEHFDRRLDALLDEAAASGEGTEITPQDFDDMEREALELLRKRRSS